MKQRDQRQVQVVEEVQTGLRFRGCAVIQFEDSDGDSKPHPGNVEGRYDPQIPNQHLVQFGEDGSVGKVVTAC
jgi:hypothetical protein